MKSAKKSKSEDEFDEDTPSKETLERRRDRKLKDDITNMMYRMEMESIKPSFDVLLQTGLHRGHYGRNFYKKRRPQTSKGLHGGIDEAGDVKHGRSHSAGKDETAESRYSGDRHARLSTVKADSDKPKTYARELDGEAWWMSEFRDLSPALHHKMLEIGGGESRVAGGMRSPARHHKTLEIGGGESHVTGGMRSPARHHKTLEVGGGDSHVAVGIRSRAKDDASPGSSLSAMVLRASRLSTDDVDDARASLSSHAAPRRSGDYHHHPGAAVISVEELPRPQRGTYLVQETERTLEGVEDIDRPWSAGSLSQPYWWRKSSTQSDGPHDVGLRPISLHGDDLMAYVNETQSTPGDFTLGAILARQEESKQQQPRLPHVAASTGNVYATDDEIEQLYHLLDNPFSGHDYERTVPKQQITFSDKYSTLPYAPKTIITSPPLRYT